MREEKKSFKDELRDFAKYHETFAKYGEILENPKLSSEQKLKELSNIKEKNSKKTNESKDER